MKRALPFVFVLALVGLVSHHLNAADKADKPAKTEKDENRVFELRTYTTHEGKLDNLHARFRDHTNAIFQKHGMTLVAYWTPTDDALSKNTLIYVLAFKNADARAKAWAGFRKDPAWKKAYKASIADGKIVKKVQSVVMSPTDYSPMK